MSGLRLMAFDLMDFRGVGDGFTKNIEAIKDFFFFLIVSFYRCRDSTYRMKIIFYFDFSHVSTFYLSLNC